MSEQDPRVELRELARSVRRHLERERAAGNAELLLKGAGAVVSRGGAPEPPAAPPSPAPALARRAPAALAPRAPAAAPPSPAAPTAAVGPGRRVAAAPSAAGPPHALAPSALEPPDDDARDIFNLPPVHPTLNAIGAAREAMVASSRPVLDRVATATRACRKCGLCETRTQAVPGVGSAASGIVFVGEAPGADEDAKGEPFVGRAGQLLTDIIKAMDERQLIPGVPLSRETVYICNVLKCRPPENRNPLPNEVEQCAPYLHQQLQALQPRIICCLGKFAAELLCGVKGTIASLRGKTFRYHGAKLIVTYHPAALLRNPGWKRPVWEDMQRLAQEYRSESTAR